MPIFKSNDCFGNVRALERRDFFRRWGRRAIGGALIAAVVFGGYCGYHVWREKHLATQAQDFLARGNYRSATLTARHLLQLNANNVTACRVMAENADRSGEPDALPWRQRVAALEPGQPENAIALAATALRVGQIELADRILEALPQRARAGVKYHQLAAGIALGEKQFAVAETHLTAAVQIEPENAPLAVKLATVRLALPDVFMNEKARTDLARLSDQPGVRLESLRALAGDALSHESRAAAERWATQLNSEKGATLSDGLLYLDAVQLTEALSPALLDLQRKSLQSPQDSAAVITWMNRHGLAKAAIEWGFSIPATTLERPLLLAIAESYSLLKDWNGLQLWIDEKNWGDAECFRLAVQSHVVHQINLPERGAMGAREFWRAALKAAQSRPDHLAQIATFGEGWGYTAEAEEAWWMIANGNESAKEALAALFRIYKSKPDAHGLFRVAKRALDLNPADLVATNNYASLGLLLNGDKSSRRLATKLHVEHPANAAFTATYAFALHLEGKTSEALKEMDSLKDEQLHNPAIATYYFVMLVENGNMERAHQFLAAANEATLLPEEQQLLTAATYKLLTNDWKNIAKSVAHS